MPVTCDGGRFTNDQTLSEHMVMFAYRYSEWNGPTEVRSDTPDNFVANLVREGCLTVMPKPAARN